MFPKHWFLLLLLLLFLSFYYKAYLMGDEGEKGGEKNNISNYSGNHPPTSPRKPGFQSFIHLTDTLCTWDMPGPIQRSGYSELIRRRLSPLGAHSGGQTDMWMPNAASKDEDKHERGIHDWGGLGLELWSAETLTCRIVIEGSGILLSAIASKEGFVVVVLIPVEGLDL